MTASLAWSNARGRQIVVRRRPEFDPPPAVSRSLLGRPITFFLAWDVDPEPPRLRLCRRRKNMPIRGSCHCGKIPPAPDVEPKEAIECNCSICRSSAARCSPPSRRSSFTSRRRAPTTLRSTRSTSASSATSFQQQDLRLRAVLRGHDPRRQGDGDAQSALRRRLRPSRR